MLQYKTLNWCYFVCVQVCLYAKFLEEVQIWADRSLCLKFWYIA